MKRARYAVPVLIVLLLILMLTWLSLRAFDPAAELFDRALVELDRFAATEAALYSDVFTARAGTLRNYDPLVGEINSLRELLENLRKTAAIDAETTAAVDQLAASVDRQEELVERFKSQNAVLHNSLAFFGRFTVRPAAPELDKAISAAAAAILHFTLDTSSAAAREVEEQLDELDQQGNQMSLGDSIAPLLAHGRLLHRLLPSVDSTLKTMRGPCRNKQDQDAASPDDLDAPTCVAGAGQVVSRVALCNFPDPGGVPGAIRLPPEVARRRVAAECAAFEHVIAGISMRFINVRPQNIDAEIDRALAEMAACVGADRAYFMVFGPTHRFHLWDEAGKPLPPGWPAGAPELAMRLGTGPDGVIHIPNVQRMPDGENKTLCLKLGLRAWACATNTSKNGAGVALGFDQVGRPCRITAPAGLGLVRMALDTIVQAVERQAIETERTRLEGRLRQAHRMEKIGTLTSGIAHNFNNILGGILGHSEVMEEHVSLDARLAHNLSGIRRGAERARDLVEQILTFGRRRDTRHKPLSIGALIAETAALLEVSLPQGVSLVIRQPPVGPIVLGENAQLQQVILNLCNNAAQAMQDGGVIEIETELLELTETRSLSHDEIRAGSYVCITVTDTGRGMNDATLARIFEPFFTTRSFGNGLGLATVRVIVQEHGGTVHVQSKVSEGSRFEIWLPRAIAKPTADSGPAERPTGKGETVMLVAHDRGLILRNEEMLAALGYEPVGFATADAAIDACRANRDRFDMAVVGHFGPVGRAIELAAALHAIAPRVPIVLASQAAIEIGADTLVATGISDVVRWPIVAEEIAVALAHSSALTRLEATPQRTATSLCTTN